jgi:hypothetical protein
MASTWSDNLKIELLGTGDTNWGNLTNNNFKWAIEDSITGYATAAFPSDANYDWAAGYTNTNASQAQRNLVINVTGSLTQTRNLVVPTIEKQYIIQNNTTGSQSIVVKTSAGTGITVPNGAKAHLFVDGTNVVQMDDYDVTRTIGTLSLTNALGASSGGTGLTALGTGVSTALGQNVTGSGGIVLATSPTLSKAVLNDGYTEEVFAISDGSTVNLDPNNGSIQTWTLGASRTPGQANWASGQSIVLQVDDGSAYTLNWSTLSVVWKTEGGVAPTLNLTGDTVIVLWKVGTTIYGARVGDA